MTITNYLGGQYFLTVDEVKVNKGIIYLIESKHSKNSILPSKSDIKDGLLKMILYSNLSKEKVNDLEIKNIPVLRLTSPLLKGYTTSIETKTNQNKFFKDNNLSQQQKSIIEAVICEAKKNKFILQLNYSK